MHVSLWTHSFCTTLGCHCDSALRAWPQQAAGLGNSRTLGLSGRLANRHSDTKLARAGPAGAERGVTNYSKSWAKLMADNHLSLWTAMAPLSTLNSWFSFSAHRLLWVWVRSRRVPLKTCHALPRITLLFPERPHCVQHIHIQWLGQWWTKQKCECSLLNMLWKPHIWKNGCHVEYCLNWLR